MDNENKLGDGMIDLSHLVKEVGVVEYQDHKSGRRQYRVVAAQNFTAVGVGETIGIRKLRTIIKQGVKVTIK